MKHTLPIVILLASLLPILKSTAQPILKDSKSTMPFGVYYYPEQWDSLQWERDIARIAQLGFEFTHFAEFAWSSLEPCDSLFTFEWLDQCVALAEKYGLKVIMCTPSATPPAWLTEKHPEILVEAENGRKIKHGMRLNCNGTNPTYQFYINRILRKMAERYGNNPAICGWQLDNEPHFEGLYDYSEHATIGFRSWLKEKYKTIDNLNKAWGGAFWSFSYNNFDQIDIPNKEEHAANPHAFIDFKRYNAQAIADALSFQYNILRNTISQQQWITTNFAYIGFLPSVNPFCSREKLDFASYTMYPMNTFLEYPEGKYGYRLGSGMELALQSDMIRSVTGKTGVMELQPGQINWGQWNSMPLPGAVKMWIWHCYGLGNEFVCTYRYRQPLYGGEQFHKGIMEPDGTTLSPGGNEFISALKEINALPKIDCAIPSEVAARQTAILWKQDNLFSIEHTQVRNDWNMWKPYLGYYKKLKTMGVHVDFITEDMDFDAQKHPFLLLLTYEMADSTLNSKLKKYVKDGGNLIMTYRTALKDNNSHLWQGPQQAPILDIIGADIIGYDQLPQTETGKVAFGNKTYSWNMWGDLLRVHKGTKVLARYDDQFYEDTPCIIHKTMGKGNVYYIGVLSTDFSLEEDVLRKIYINAGAPILNLPDYFFVEYRKGYYIAVNYTSQPVEAPIPDNTKLIVGTKLVPPGGVTVWEANN